ncbi:hypothetical protein [Mycolicibacterium elephantis]|uniref:Uncharacterized protein n=1 Tax=Mycolicibacterium elephantis DSM 44368 TaxID=1335622 RepID=A0A439DL49_9MYCO|nr:hypothetical protein [Mycolicibacterium elephantis]MCV7222730.1 hypothetical protein [Mycolicibacterium elephantis]RWA15234.1 hypothetical protein MELE44368_09470 [Mycolicibacterium elephantis DSM 44368]
MTALQDWLKYRPMGPRSLKALVCSVLRDRSEAGQAPDEDSTRRDEPVLIQPGIERC